MRGGGGMVMRRLSLTVFLVLCVLCVAQAVYYYPRLPETVASHFNRAGQPDVWSSKATFVRIYLAVTGLVTILFLAVTFTMSKIPVSLINLPNKDYWLSEERRQDTLALLSHYFLWFASATLLLLLDIFHQSFQVHLGKAGALSHPMLSLGLYIGFSVIWSVSLFVKFGKRRD
jgi:uncharacterized membrane protein